jgi:hypothetical protein
MPTARMMSVRAFFDRLNQGRTSRKTTDIDERNNLWLTESQLVKGAERFIKLNGYQRIEYNQTFNHGEYQLVSPIVGYRNTARYSPNDYGYHLQGKERKQQQEEQQEQQQEQQQSESTEFTEGNNKITTTICLLNSKIQGYDLGFFGHLESVLYDVIDSYDNTNLVLVTDSLSYLSITLKEEIGVTIENLMEEGLYMLFLNDKFDYAFFEKYDDMIENPITVYGD